MIISKNPSITVVMSVYNDSKYLQEAIQSILDQTFVDFEFIIIDDGSTDNTCRIIEQFLLKDLRIIFLKNDKNKGLSYSLNRGIKHARGKYIARMDADDISLPNRFNNQITFFQNNPNTDVLGTGAILIDKNNKEIGRKIMPKSNKEMKKILYLNSCFFHPSVIAKKEFYLPNNLYSEELLRAEDWYLWVDNYDKFNYRNTEEYLIKYRVNTSSSPNVYWDLKVLVLQGLKRREFGVFLGIIIKLYRWIKLKLKR